MAKPILSRKKAKILALGIFLFGLLLLTYTGSVWPGIMLCLGIPLAILQYLQNRMYDVAITLFVFVGAFITVRFDIQWEILLPVLFAIGGIYIFFREWLYSSSLSEKEEALEEEKQEVLEEDNTRDDTN